MQPNPERARLTYRYEALRAPFNGVCEAGWITFGLLIVIRGYGADGASSDFIKGLIPAAGFLGLLFNTVSISWASRTGKPATALVSLFIIGSALLLIGAAAVNQLVLFTVLFVIAHVIYAQQAPLMIHTYTCNYTPSERGQKVSTIMVIAAATSAAFSYFGGMLLDWDFSWFPGILLFMAAACGINAAIVRRIPSAPLEKEGIGSPLNNLGLVWRDRLFGWMLASWMLMGFANLMTIPIRVELLANPEYGINATNEQISLATVILPSLAGLLSSKLWGALFDRMNFITWRICVNSCFFVGMLLYFLGQSLPMIYIGAVFIGLGMGGGRIGWNLWVTKVAPVQKVSAYMSVHTFFTGVRGIIAPFMGYFVVTVFAPPAVGIIAAGGIVISSLMFAALLKNERFRQIA